MSRETAKAKIRARMLQGSNRNARPLYSGPSNWRKKIIMPKMADDASAELACALAGKQVSKKPVSLPIVRFTELKD